MYAELSHVLAIVIACCGPGDISYAVAAKDGGGGGGMVQAAPHRSPNMTGANWGWRVAGVEMRWRMWWDIPVWPVDASPWPVDVRLVPVEWCCDTRIKH